MGGQPRMVCSGLQGFLRIKTFHFKTGRTGVNEPHSSYMRFLSGVPKPKERIVSSSEWKGEAYEPKREPKLFI